MNISLTKGPLRVDIGGPSCSLVQALIDSLIKNSCPLRAWGNIDCSSHRVHRVQGFENLRFVC